MRSRSPTRILHVVAGMDRGGIETWLMHILRHLDRERFHMDFMIQTTEKEDYEDEIRELGSQIFRYSHRQRPVKHDRDFRRILRDQGPYDVLHSHRYLYSGYALHRARQADIPVRIAHSHNDFSPESEKRSAPWKMYATLMRRWIANDATVGLAASREAARALFGPTWEADPRLRVLYYGIDLEPFWGIADPAAVRLELGIPANAFVMGHVGRFFEQKNHEFLVEVASEVIMREPKARLLMVGDGPLRRSIEQRVARAGIQGRTIFAGVRPDVPRLMLGAMDVFIMPSFFEGLPMVGIEAQAAGLPFVLSDAISKEMDVAHPLIHRLSLSQPASVWAETILAARNAKPSIRQDGRRLIEESPFNIDRSARELEKVYGG